MLVFLRTFLLDATGLVSVRHSQTQVLTSVRVLLQQLWGTNPTVETEQALSTRQRCGVGYTVQTQSNPSPRVLPLT